MVVKALDRAITVIIKFWLPVFIPMGIIFYNSSIPGNNIPSVFPFQDIGYHFLIYLALGFLVARALKNTSFSLQGRRLIIFSVIFCAIYGISDELHQAFVPYRSVSGFDVFIDTLGSIAGALIYL